jgi:hypothetical protein
MTTVTTHTAGRLVISDGTRSVTTGPNGVGGRVHHGPGIARPHRLHHTRSARFAANPATQIPRERIEQYSRLRSTPSIPQITNRREPDNVELRLLPTTLVTRVRAEGSNSISSDSRLGPSHQPPRHIPATRSAPQLTAEQRMAGAVEPLSTPARSASSRRLSFTLARTGTRHSDRTGRRLSTTSSHATTHSWHGSSGILANLPTPGLLASLAGAAHYTGNPKVSDRSLKRGYYADATLTHRAVLTARSCKGLFWVEEGCIGR